MSSKKIILILLVGFITLAVVAVAYILLGTNPNDYKSEIVDQVKTNTGRELVIDGDIDWRLLPSIGLTLGKISINNPEGFPEQPLLQLESAKVDLAFWPLLSKKIEIGLISIEGLSVFIHTRKDGVSNLDQPDDFEKELKEAKEKSAESQSELPGIKGLTIKGIQVQDANVLIENLAAQTKQTVGPLNFTLGKLELGKAVPISLSIMADTGDLKVSINSKGQIRIGKELQQFEMIDLNTEITASGESLPNKQLDIQHQMSGNYNLSQQIVSLDSMTLSLLGMELKGKVEAKLAGKPDINYELTAGAIDLDAITVKSPQKPEQKGDTTPEQSIDLSWMNDFNVKGLVVAESIKVNNLTVSDIQLPMALKNGKLNLSGIKANLYEGKLLADASLDGRSSIPKYSFKSTMNNVQALPLIKDLTEKEIVSGMAKISLNIKGSGLDDLSMKKNANGNGAFFFTKGAIHGVNVAELIRTTYAKIKGQTVTPSNEPQQTDFASFTGSFTLGQGIVKNSDLKLLSPLLRVSGNGSADIIKETMRYHLETAIVGTLEGQGGKPITDLKNVTIPLRIKGEMVDPDISLEMDKILKDSVKKKAKKKLKDKLKGLFN
ncbi:MAG: AsmA family protein [Gammaproteobacteria bacterium]|nr:AsmA family protein [Gammaproteobacteria bacterium]